MLRFRKAKARICRRFSVFGGKQSAQPHQHISVSMAQVTSAVHQRQMAGMVTTLRQLHTISGLSQPEALTVIAQLEKAGIVIISHNLGDAFESSIRLSEDAQQRLDLAASSDAAAAA